MERRDGAAALLVSCLADPGVPELQEAVSIPVIGAGSVAVALSLSRAAGSEEDRILVERRDAYRTKNVGFSR